MIKPSPSAMLVVLVASAFASAVRPRPAAAAPCAPAGADATALHAVWDAMDAACPCATATTRRTYVACATTVAKGAVTGGTLPAACKKTARTRATLSTCGRPGTAVCCRTTSNGTVKGKIVGSPARCTAPAGGQACIASRTNVTDGCSAAGCVTCGNGVIEPGEACEPPGVGNCTADCQLPATCGNGVVEPGEACEPPGAAGCTDSCTTGTCTAAPGGEIAIACLTSDFTSASLGAGSGGYLATWSGRANSSSTVIRARRLDASALPIEPSPITISDPDDVLSDGGPRAAGDADGWYVGWYSSSYPQWAINGLHVTGGGALEARHSLGSGLSIGQCQSGTLGPSALVSEAPDQFAVALTDYAGCVLSGLLFHGHHASRVTFAAGGATTTSLGAPDPIAIPPVPPAAVSGQPVALARGGTDTAAIIVQATFDGTAVLDRAINAHWLPAPGDTTRLSSADAVAGTGVGAGGSAGQMLAAWAANTGGGTATEVRALRFTRAAGPLDPDGGIVIASGVSPQSMPEVVFDGTTWLVAWLDGSTAVGPWSVLAVGVRTDGTIVDPTPRVLAAGVAQVPPSLTSRGAGWLVGIVRPAGAGLWSLNAVPVPP